MCDPAIALAVVGAGQAFMEHQGAVADADAKNAATAQTHQSARDGTKFKHQQETRKYIEDQAAIREEGFDASLDKTAAMATAQAIGGAWGIQGASVEAVIASEAQKGARNAGRIDMKQENSYMDFLAGVDAASMQGNQQISANPFTSGPSMMDGIMGVAMNSGLGYATGGGFDNFSLSSLKIPTSSPSPVKVSSSAYGSNPLYVT